MLDAAALDTEPGNVDGFTHRNQARSKKRVNTRWSDEVTAVGVAPWPIPYHSCCIVLHAGREAAQGQGPFSVNRRSGADVCKKVRTGKGMPWIR